MIRMIRHRKVVVTSFLPGSERVSTIERVSAVEAVYCIFLESSWMQLNPTIHSAQARFTSCANTVKRANTIFMQTRERPSVLCADFLFPSSSAGATPSPVSVSPFPPVCHFLVCSSIIFLKHCSKDAAWVRACACAVHVAMARSFKKA